MHLGRWQKITIRICLALLIFRIKAENFALRQKILSKVASNSVEFEATLLIFLYYYFWNSNYKLTSAKPFSKQVQQHVLNFQRVFLKTIFSEMACTITQKLMNGSIWNWTYFWKIWSSSIWYEIIWKR